MPAGRGAFGQKKKHEAGSLAKEGKHTVEGPTVQDHKTFQDVQNQPTAVAVGAFTRAGRRRGEGALGVFDPKLATGVGTPRHDNTEPGVARVHVQPAPQTNVDLDAHELEGRDVPA